MPQPDEQRVPGTIIGADFASDPITGLITLVLHYSSQKRLELYVAKDKAPVLAEGLLNQYNLLSGHAIKQFPRQPPGPR